MCRYKKIDLENWCRKEHYLYYTNSLNVEVNMTANIDVSELLSFCHTNGYKFYPTLIYCVTKVLNRIDNFKMFKDKNGDLCVWDSLVPNYTIFHEEDHTFSDCWTDFTDDFDSFYKNITYDMELGKTKREIRPACKLLLCFMYALDCIYSGFKSNGQWGCCLLSNHHSWKI